MQPIHVVLVGTLYSGNIGYTARAMANMGGCRLILVRPECEVDEKTHQGAAGAQEQLNSIVRYATWDDFYQAEGQGLRIAFTRRMGKNRKSEYIKELLHNLRDENPQALAQPIYLFFGPEDHGLSADDMGFMHFRCSLPTYGKFKSLSLAHAVLLALYITQEFLRTYSSKTKEWSAVPEPMDFPDQWIRDWLTAMGFNIKARKASAYLTLRKLLLQNVPTRRETQVLQAILQQNIRKLKASKEKLDS